MDGVIVLITLMVISANADLGIAFETATVDDLKITYILTMTNAGPSDAENVTVTDPVPVNTIFVSATFVSATGAAGWIPTRPPVDETGDIVFSNTLFPSGETAVFEIEVRVPPTDNPAPVVIIRNTAMITSSTTDPDTSNNAVAVVTTIRLPP